ncbi:MAG: PHP domain-containing protein [Dethiobacter sp.]|jgi:PHP family Zn ribbon phosphoesterase|nr:PHP domain-containing protein [Dethiobacter sp.]MBS3900971.1 PHP domain-containing protein [Dethiobacter sp.]
MLKWIKADLHVHTVLSACADLDMSPREIINTAKLLGINLLAVTDHHAIDNVAACREAADGTGITVLFGMEVQTREEVHLVCLFPSEGSAVSFAALVDQHLPPSLLSGNTGEIQAVVTASDQVVRFEQRKLLASLDLSVEAVCCAVAGLQGLSIAAHVDRPQYSLLGNLGFIPPQLPVAALETSSAAAALHRKHPSTVGYPLLCSSDAHCLPMLCQEKYTYFFVAEDVNLSEISMALRGESGRKVCIKS